MGEWCRVAPKQSFEDVRSQAGAEGREQNRGSRTAPLASLQWDPGNPNQSTPGVSPCIPDGTSSANSGTFLIPEHIPGHSVRKIR